MKGGFKVYRGSPGDARRYVESDHSTAADYYLTEAGGIAETYSVNGDGKVTATGMVTGPEYERWVAGLDPRTGEPKGAIRRDEHGVRFIETVINGPKSWSLAAALHPDVADAYGAAQDRAVEAIAGYLGRESSTRVGGRGAQVQVPVDEITIATVRHRTSRASDPFTHVHMQIGARVRAGGKWRGLDTAVAFRMHAAINGIGHRAMLADPGFRSALAGHGYTMDDVSGELHQLAAAVPAMSKRAGQIGDTVRRFEAAWDKANPGVQASQRLRQRWARDAWAKGRPAKEKLPAVGADLTDRWVRELGEFVDVGVLRSAGPVQVGGVLPGEVDREALAGFALQILSNGPTGRSTWNRHDVRGTVEAALAEIHVLGGDEVVREMSEDVTERALGRCVSVVSRKVPAHIRHLTSVEVIEAEEDLRGRLAGRGVRTPVPAAAMLLRRAERATGRHLDEGQTQAARALAGTGDLVVVTGPAGTGKTSTLKAAKHMVEALGQRVVVVAPSKKAADVAGKELGCDARTVSVLAYSHGYRWDGRGVWKRLTPGQVDERTGRVYRPPKPERTIGRGDLLVVDEAGMLTRTQMRALLTIADEQGTRVAVVGDPRQLPAVGRGGVMEEAATWAQAPAQVELSAVHRFKDPEYAELTLRMRSGKDPEGVFRDLLGRGGVEIHEGRADAVAALARLAADARQGRISQSVSASTNEAATEINDATRSLLVGRGLVDDQRVVVGVDGLRIGRGDVVMTRLNDHDKDVANRETWTVTRVTAAGGLRLVGDDRKTAEVDRAYVAGSVQLGYASTVHGVQGATTDHGAVLLDENTGNSAVYVGLTRGRGENTAYVVAEDVDAAEALWVAAADRDRADLGLGRAREAAEVEAESYAPIAEDLDEAGWDLEPEPAQVWQGMTL